MLASLLFHPVLDAARCQREIPGSTGSPCSLAEVARDTVQAMVSRLNLPKWEAERIQQIIGAQKKLFNLPGRAPLPRSLLLRHYFPEALELFAVGVRATGKGSRTLRRLRQTAHDIAAAPRRKNHRRRRPRNRRRAVAPEVTASPDATRLHP